MGSDSVASWRRCASDVLSAVLIACLYVPAFAGVPDAPARVVVAWTEGSPNDGRLRSFPAADPWNFDRPTLSVGGNATLRVAGDLLYAVSRTDASVSVIDLNAWTVLRTLSVGAGREPVDIAVIAPDLAYVSCADETHLLRFDPSTGDTTPVVDLSIFADADGVPELNMMALHEGRLFIQLRRFDPSTLSFAQPAMLAVMDVSTEQLIDADAATPGTQAIELQGMAPKLKMQVVESTRRPRSGLAGAAGKGSTVGSEGPSSPHAVGCRLFVSASGDFFDDGGLEIVDLDTLQSLGLIVREDDDRVGADLGAFVLVTPDRGYLTFSTDLAVSSHLVEFTVSGGVVPSGALFETVGYFVPTLPLDPQSGTFFFPDGGAQPSSVHVLDAGSASHLATISLGAGDVPTDVIVIRSAVAGPPIPAASNWSVAILALLVIAAGTVLLVRGQRRRAPEV